MNQVICWKTYMLPIFHSNHFRGHETVFMTGAEDSAVSGWRQLLEFLSLLHAGGHRLCLNRAPAVRLRLRAVRRRELGS